MKGNNGRAVAARRSRTRKLMFALFVTFGVTIVFVTTMMQRRSNGGGGSSNSNRNNSAVVPTKKGLLYDMKRRMKLDKESVPKSIRNVVKKHDLQQILNANVHLVDITVDLNELRHHLKNYQFDNENDGTQSEEEGADADAGEDPNTRTFPSYNGIYGTFCTVDWELHKNDPSTYPMFRDLVDNSPKCSRGSSITGVNIYDVVRLAREQDDNFPADTKAMQLSGVVFHESRCGSTLTANILAAINPKAHRVYSESPPPATSLGYICGDDFSICNRQVAASIFRDVIYLMSRTNKPNEENNVFFKIQSVGTRNIKTFTTAFPTTPYLMVYREPVQVMMSHLKGNNLRNANCVRGRRKPPLSVVKAVKKYTPEISANEIRPEDYCAAHLASITETMVNDHTDFGVPINYGILTDTLYNDILPYWLNIPRLSSTQLATVQGVAAVYSKNRGGNRVEGNFQSDSEKKEEMASPAVRFAAQTYLTPSYTELETLSKKALARIVTIQEQRKASGAFTTSEQ
jgi:hypothetical protein